jgi:hypothetical protein
MGSSAGARPRFASRDTSANRRCTSTGGVRARSMGLACFAEDWTAGSSAHISARGAARRPAAGPLTRHARTATPHFSRDPPALAPSRTHTQTQPHWPILARRFIAGVPLPQAPLPITRALLNKHHEPIAPFSSGTQRRTSSSDAPAAPRQPASPSLPSLGLRPSPCSKQLARAPPFRASERGAGGPPARVDPQKPLQEEARAQAPSAAIPKGPRASNQFDAHRLGHLGRSGRG